MSNEISSSNQYSTPNGDYYVGMTADYAKEKGLLNKKIGIDFFDIDKNNDSVLDVFEIKSACEKQAMRNLIGGLGEYSLGLILTLIGVTTEGPSLGLSTTLTVSGAGMMADGFSRSLESTVKKGSLGPRGFIKQELKGFFSNDNDK